MAHVSTCPFLRPAVGTHVSLFPLCFQEEVEYVEKFHESNAGSSLGPLSLKVELSRLLQSTSYFRNRGF